MRHKFGYRKRRPLSTALIVHVIINCLLLVICMVFTFFFASGKGSTAVNITIVCIMAAVMVIELLFFIHHVIKQVVEIEKTVEMLKQKNEEDGIEGDKELEYERYSLIDTIQILMKRESNANLMKKQAEIDTLQNQINPHFLYNTLETIRGQAICCGAMDIAETTKALADIFRYNISKKGSMIHLNEELQNIDSYMKIQRIRFNDKFSLEKEIDSDVEMLKIPKLIIQPIIENALKHGLEIKREKGNIHIRSFRTQDTLFVIVKDNGLGISTETLNSINKRLQKTNQLEIAKGKSTNVGLVNINDRIKMIYGPKFGVSIKSIQNIGTEVTLAMGIME